MDLRTQVHLASKSAVKLEATKKVFASVITHDSKSGVSEQPVGTHEIRRGAYNRLNSVVGVLPVIALESGITSIDRNPSDSTICVLRTSVGTFESWIHYSINATNKLDKWAAGDRQTTFGKFAYPDNEFDWYAFDTRAMRFSLVECVHIQLHSRLHYMTRAVEDVMQKYEAVMKSMPLSVLPAPLVNFKNVKFIDIQHTLLKHPNELAETTFRLSNRLLFNKVVAMEARGFPLLGEFMRNKYPIIMARKPGKLPSDVLQVEYKKEYGTDQLCIEKNAIQPGDKVIIIDDVIATGGTMRAAENLVKLAGGEVVAFVAPFVIVNEEQNLICGDISTRCRYLCNQQQADQAMQSEYANLKIAVYDNTSLLRGDFNDLALILPPSMHAYDKYNLAVPIKWGRFARSSNIWFNPGYVTGKKVRLFMDPSNARESFDVLQLLKIIHRKDPKEVVVVIPFLEQGTQDRIEYDGKGGESVAAVDTIAKLLGDVKVQTFDLHAEQSQFAFYDLKFSSLVSELWRKYSKTNNAIPVFPDEGAAKRYGKILDGRQYITFRKIRDGAKRMVYTDSKIGAGNYVIIDDMVRSGGTMHEVATYLLKLGASTVDALFAHAPFEAAASKNMAVFADIWTTNSCLNSVPDEWVKLDVYDVVCGF